MDPAATPRLSEPSITVFMCERCASDMPLAPAGTWCRVHRGCIGEVDTPQIREAFATGADGVLILGCVGRQCSVPRGDVSEFRHIHRASMLLSHMGLDPTRLHREWVTPRETPRLPAIVAAFRRRVAALPPRHLASGEPSEATCQA
jgi:coenzyme F420-reducing hydrogenase delta subunit